MTTLANLHNSLWNMIAVYLTPQMYALYRGLNSNIWKAVNNISLDYSKWKVDFSEIENKLKYDQYMGLNLRISLSILYQNINSTLFCKLQTLKLDLRNYNARSHLPSLNFAYSWHNFPCLKVLHLSNCNTSVTVKSYGVLVNLIEFKIENFSELTSLPLLEKCPHIQKVMLENCPLLKEVSVITTPIEQIHITNCPELKIFPFMSVHTFYYTGPYFDTSFCTTTVTLHSLYIRNARLIMNKLLPLETLCIDDCKVISLPCMSQLKHLLISGCNVRELPSLPALETIRIFRCCNLTDFTCLTKCRNLHTINTMHNKPVAYPVMSTLISFTNANFMNLNLYPLQNNSNLTTLKLYRNQLLTLEGISSLNQLTTLVLAGGNLTSLTGIENCSQLGNISLLDIPSLIDISALQSCTLLINVKIKNSPSLIDVSVLKNCTQIQQIDFGIIGVTDVTVLMFLKNLESLTLHRCPNLTTLPSLTQCTKLGTVIIMDVPITVLPILNSNVRHLDLNCNTKLQNISSIEHLTNLITLDLICCYNLTDISMIPHSDVLTITLLKKLSD